MIIMKRIQSHRLQASSTIEAAMVMGIILICLVTAILFAYRCRDNIFKKYAASEAALMTAHTEETWLPDRSEKEAIENYANTRLHTIGRYAGSDISSSRDELLDIATVRFREEEYTAKIADIENYMRLSSVVKDFIDKKKKEDDS